MADCKKYSEMISCYADGELSENDKSALQRHLDECASCRSLLSIYTSISEAAAESLKEPPDGFTDSVMEKIRLLPKDEKSSKPKSLRPVIISFLAAAACLALAVIVSPQLFGFGGSSNMTASQPMASAAYDAASKEAAMDEAEPNIAMKAAGSADTSGDTSADTSADSGTVYQTQMAPTTVSAAPVPMPSVTLAPEYGVNGRGDTDALLKQYYAVFFIEGQLPDVLKDDSMTDNKDGSFNIEISIDTAKQLIKDGFQPDMGVPEATKALVKYTPAP